jgi:hypothetical protein
MKMEESSNREDKLLGRVQDVEYVPVVVLDDIVQANDYRQLLEENDIAVVIEEDESSKSVSVMVPEECLDEAHVVIEAQDAYDDFYDLALDEDADDFEDGLLDDEF